jgi:oxygen-independent coproporphyrinogen-3 oxidase
MKILFNGHNFKYETEAVVKLFIFTEHFEFINDAVKPPENDDFIFSKLKKCKNNTYLYTIVSMNGKKLRKCFHFSNDTENYKNTCELELCRLVYTILVKITGISPPWGLLTGIRPVKRVSQLMDFGMSDNEICSFLDKKYNVSRKKSELACLTANIQRPLLKNLTRNSVSLYISIPFCPTRCSYCSFVSHSMNTASKLIPDYIRLLCRELEILSDIVKKLNVHVTTIYFGGGTPTSLNSAQLEILMKKIKESFDLSAVTEYNIEAGRPDTINQKKLLTIKNFGATRISINPQTFNNSVLETIGRHHTAEQTVNAFELARKCGFDNINMDLIAGLPSDTNNSFNASLDKTIQLNPDSITVHTLTVKRSASLFENGIDSTDVCVSDMTDYSFKRLTDNDYFPYYLYRQKNTVENLENIGYARKSKESLYNIYIMDEIQTILGAGCAASTKLVSPDGKIKRIHNYKFPYEYVRNFNELMKKKDDILSFYKEFF